MRKFITFGPALVVLLTTVVTLVAAPAAVRMIGYAQTEATIRLANQTLQQDDILHRINRATRAIAAAVEPSVVHIGIEQPDRRGRFARVSQGSGWVYDLDGHIITNAHVVRGATRVTVQFNDGRQMRAEVVGTDRKTDIAVLKAPVTEGIFPANRASDYEPEQGDRVYAFGSPFGFKFSMSEGIISGVGRDPEAVIGEDGYTNFIQTDAAVNPGNSGGPLVNVDAKVIGMNVAIATGRDSSGTTEGQSSGISFAIPLSTIEPVVQQIISGGESIKGFMGIQHLGADDVNSKQLVEMGFRGRGVYVQEVTRNEPAALAGVRSGDIITAIGGRSITGIPAFRSIIANRGPGETVNVTLWRAGEEVSVGLTLGTAPPSRFEMNQTLQALEAFGITEFGRGEGGALVIADVAARSKAAEKGFRSGQVIAAVNDQPVTEAFEFLSKVFREGLLRGRNVGVTVTLPGGGEARKLTVEGPPS